MNELETKSNFEIFMLFCKWIYCELYGVSNDKASFNVQWYYQAWTIVLQLIACRYENIH